MIDKTKFRETFWEICDERDLYLYNITNEEIDMLLAETVDRFEKHEVSPPAFPCVLCRGEIEKTPRVIALCDACLLRQTVEQYATTLKNVMAKKAALKDEVERLQLAVGLATTAVPTMEMDSDHPVEMMQRVVAEVERLRAEVERLGAALMLADRTILLLQVQGGTP
jgi:hypothetical protein